MPVTANSTLAVIVVCGTPGGDHITISLFHKANLGVPCPKFEIPNLLIFVSSCTVISAVIPRLITIECSDWLNDVTWFSVVLDSRLLIT